MMSKWIAGLFALCMLTLATTAAPASAAPESYGRLGYVFWQWPDGTPAHQQRVALNQGTDRLYVTDVVGDQIRVFDAAGAGATEGTPFGAGEITDPLGVAVDQETGAVYVSDADDIVKYTSAGVLDPSFTSPGVTGPLAFDQDHDELVVADVTAGQVRHFTSTGTASVTRTPFDGSDGSTAFAGLQDVAVTSTGDVVVVDSDGDPALNTGTSRVERYTATGEHQATYGPVTMAARVAVKADTDEVYVSGNQNSVDTSQPLTVHVFALSGGEAEQVLTLPGAANEYESTMYSTVSGLAVDDGLRARLYVGTDVDKAYGGVYGGTSVQIYQRPLPPIAPVVTGASAAATPTSAYLTAEIHPQRATTTYVFDYGTTTAYGTTTPSRTIAAGDASVVSKAYITGLTPGTTYHYRLTAKNAFGTATGPDQTFTTRSATKPADTCANADIRRLQGSEGLPDCRAFEQVTPVDKNGANVSLGKPVQAARQPGAAAYTSSTAFPGGSTALAIGYYRSKRSATGWTTVAADLPQLNHGRQDVVRGTQWFTPSLSKSVSGTNRALVPSAVERGTGIYAHDLDSGEARLIAQDPNDPTITGTFNRMHNDFLDIIYRPVGDATPDLSRVVFGNPSAGAGEEAHVYESVNGDVRAVDRLPDGTLSTSSNMGSTAALAVQNARVMSDDGRRIAFVELGTGANGVVWVREDGATTRLVSRSHRTGADPTAPTLRAQLVSISANGRYVFFSTDEAPLVDAVQGTLGGRVIYRADLDTDTLAALNRRAPSEEDFTDGIVQVLAVSEDGERVYFKSAADLLPGAVRGGTNVFLWERGALKLVGTGEDPVGEIPFSASRDGRFFEFLSSVDLVGAARRSPACPTAAGAPGFCAEMYAYSADSGDLACISCGDSPAGPAAVDGADFDLFKPTAVLEDGTFFFQTPTSLVPADVNGKIDVYEWKQGQVGLLSTGTDDNDALYLGVSDDGTDMYFATQGRLVAQDTDKLRDLYTSRRDGGLPAQNRTAVAGTVCSQDSCQGPPSRPAAPLTAATVTFAGPADDASVIRRGSGSVSVARLTPVTGVAATVKVRVPGAGTIAVAGSGLRPVSRSARRAGSYAVRVVLSAASQRLLRRGRTLKRSLRVSFRPTTGRVTTKTVALTYKPPKAKKAAARKPSGGR